MQKLSTQKLTTAAIAAAAYSAVTLIALPISFGPLQLRIAEVLCILPYFFPETMWGLFTGCIIANIFGGNGILDIVFGSLATLAAGWCTSKFKPRWLACLPPAVFNGVIVGAVLAATLTPAENFFPAMLLYGGEVFVSEFFIMYVLGFPLMYSLPKTKTYKKIMAKREK